MLTNETAKSDVDQDDAAVTFSADRATVRKFRKIIVDADRRTGLEGAMEAVASALVASFTTMAAVYGTAAAEEIMIDTVKGYFGRLRAGGDLH